MKFKNYFLLLSFILLFQSSAHTFDLFKSFKKNNSNKTTAPSAQSTNLQIQSYSPTGELKNFRTIEPIGLNMEIFIMFNKPMVALEDLDKQKDRVQLVFNPPLKGDYKWEGTDSLSFRPYSLPKATTITVTVPAGTKSLKGKKLETPFSWTFETERPEIKQSYPYHNSDQFGLTNQIFLYFNMPMKKQDVEKFITLKYRYLFFTIPCKYNFINECITNDTGVETNYIINLTPKEKLKIDTSYSIVVKKDFKSELGDLGTKQDAVIYFKTYATFKYKGRTEFTIRPGESVQLEFSNPVSLHNIISNSIISGCTNQLNGEEYSYYESKTPYFYFNDHPQSQLFIKMSKSIKDLYNNSLENPPTIKINISDYYPYFWATYGTGYIESYMSGTLPIKAMNIKNYTMLYEPIKNKDKIINWDKLIISWRLLLLMKKHLLLLLNLMLA